MIMIIITKLVGTLFACGYSDNDNRYQSCGYSNNDNRYQLVVSREAVAILIMIIVIN